MAVTNGSFFTEDILTVGIISLSFYIATTALVLVFVPFAIFWYEGYDVEDGEVGERR